VAFIWKILTETKAKQSKTSSAPGPRKGWRLGGFFFANLVDQQLNKENVGGGTPQKWPQNALFLGRNWQNALFLHDPGSPPP